MNRSSRKQLLALRLARKRLTSYLRDRGYNLGVNQPNLSKRITDILVNDLGFVKTEKHTKFQIKISKIIELSGRDLAKRTPEWANKRAIKNLYRQCKVISGTTGILHHIDHVIPIKGKLVSGLHVIGNLAIIDAKSNLSKSNKF